MSKRNDKKYSAVSATVWSAMEKVLTQVVSFTINIFLARILSPYEYGVVGMTAIFMSLSNIFVDSGFSNALIRKKERTEEDISTAFYFNIGTAVLIYLLLFISAPFISRFYAEPQLVPLIRIIGITIIFYSIGNVQTAILTANLNMKFQTYVNILSQMPSGIIAIYLAYKGFGIYALALQQIIASFLRVLFLFYFVRWVPRCCFSIQAFKYFWNFGSKLMGATIIGATFSEITSVLIGKFIGTNELGYYTKANQLNTNVNSISVGIVQKIALPLLSRNVDNPELLIQDFRMIMRILVMFVAPLTTFLYIASEDIIVLLWTEKWLPSAEIFKLLVLGAMFAPIAIVSLILMQAVNKTGLILKLEIPKKILFGGILMVGFQFGIRGLCIALVCTNLLAGFINMWATKKIVNYAYGRQIVDIFKYVFLSFTIGLIVSSLCRTEIVYVNLLMYFMLVMIIYFLSLYILKDEAFKKSMYLAISAKKRD